MAIESVPDSWISLAEGGGFELVVAGIRAEESGI